MSAPVVYSRALELELQCAIVRHVAEFDVLPGHADTDDRTWQNCLSDLCNRYDCVVCKQAITVAKYGRPFQLLAMMRHDRRLLERAERNGSCIAHQLPNALQIGLIARTVEKLHVKVTESLKARGG